MKVKIYTDSYYISFLMDIIDLIIKKYNVKNISASDWLYLQACPCCEYVADDKEFRAISIETGQSGSQGTLLGPVKKEILRICPKCGVVFLPNKRFLLRQMGKNRQEFSKPPSVESKSSSD